MKPHEIGKTQWTNHEIRSAIPAFLELYQHRPIQNNQGGMKIPHAFATWFMLKQLQPCAVIESGIWKGQSTWLIEQTLPHAEIYSIDVNLKNRAYISKSVTYYQQDFATINWDHLSKENTLLFFDDHQNALERIRVGKAKGFRQFIFEDNYPAGHVGDCYSLKKAFQGAGFQAPKTNHSLKSKLKNLIKSTQSKNVPANQDDARFLSDVLAIYYEFPPVFKAKKTRWGADWNEQDYPTPTALYTELESEHLSIFQQEAQDYTWICYAEIK